MYILQSLRSREQREMKFKVIGIQNCLCGIWNAHFCTEESSLVLT